MILVVDDDSQVRASIRRALEELGYPVREAPDGVSALALVKVERPSLVVLDYVMPGLSGAEVAAHIRATHPDQPILFVSGYNETDAIRNAAPDASILAKPFRAAALEEAVRAALPS